MASYIILNDSLIASAVEALILKDIIVRAKQKLVVATGSLRAA
jgi:hypothetical protein